MPFLFWVITKTINWCQRKSVVQIVKFYTSLRKIVHWFFCDIRCKTWWFYEQPCFSHFFLFGVFHTYKQVHGTEMWYLNVEPAQTNCTKVVDLVRYSLYLMKFICSHTHNDIFKRIQREYFVYFSLIEQLYVRRLAFLLTSKINFLWI